MLRVLVASSMLAVAFGSFCGDSLVPYSFEVLADGQPVLGCGRPTCFGWGPNGRPYSQLASFYRIRGTADGFARQDVDAIPPFGAADARRNIPQSATCEPGFGSVSCAAGNSWVGGIAPLLNVTAYPATLRCCTYEPLRRSEDRGVANVGSGQIVVGGEVLSDGIQYAFDYISDVVKYVNGDGSVAYDVAIRRFACAPLPDRSQLAKQPKMQHGDVRFAPNRAFQDPIAEVNQPIPPPNAAVQTQDFEQNGVIEDIVREDGIQLAPGTNFQPVVPQQQFIPPPQAPVQQFFAPPPVQAPVAAAPAYGGYFPVAYQQGATFCFTADSTVALVDGTTKRMDELKKNDFVMAVTSTGVDFVPVTFWLHRVPEQVAEFHRFETEDGKIIKLTGQHYIYKGDCSRVGQTIESDSVARHAVYAEEVSQGDCLYTVDEERHMREVRVVKADTVVETGIYAPMTSNGKIFVNGVHASCHTNVHSHGIQNSYFSLVDQLKKVFGTSEEVVDTPMGLNLIMSVFDLIAPKDLVTF